VRNNMKCLLFIALCLCFAAKVNRIKWKKATHRYIGVCIDFFSKRSYYKTRCSATVTKIWSVISHYPSKKSTYFIDFFVETWYIIYPTYHRVVRWCGWIL